MAETDAAPKTTKPAPRRTPDQVSADLESARQSLLANVDALQEYVKPGNVAGRGLGRVEGFFVTGDGSVRVRNIAITVGVLAVYVLYRVRR